MNENKSDDIIESVDLEDYIGKIVSSVLDSTGDLNEIELWLLVKDIFVIVMNLVYVWI